jgi:hypothetical protein
MDCLVSRRRTQPLQAHACGGDLELGRFEAGGTRRLAARFSRLRETQQTG